MERHWIVQVCNAVMTVASICATFVGVALADDWPMLGRDGTRNGVSTEIGAPTHWSVENHEKNHVARESRGIRWSAPLGSETHSSPVVSDGLVWIGTNNTQTGIQSSESQHSVLKCFRVTDGEQVYEYISPKFGTRIQDAGWTGLGSSPLIEGDRLWLTTNRSEVLCWDIGPLIRGEGTPRELWKLDLIKTFDTFPHVPLMGPPRPCSIGASWNDRIFVTTNNGVGEDWTSVPKPDAANLVCLNKNTGEVYWKDSSPGSNILLTQLSSPTVATIRGQTQVIVPQSDGWVRAFDPMTGEKLWEFDINAKESILKINFGNRNSLLGNAVVYEDRVYIASGKDAEQGGGRGRLVCIDPTKRGDVSAELAVNAEGQILPHRRRQAVDTKVGEKAIANPNSALVWEFVNCGKEFEDEMHITIGSVAIAKGLVIAADFEGLVHCLDAKTGRRFWSYDTKAAIWATPLIVDGKVYIADEDGEVAIFGLSADPEVACRRLNGQIQPLTEIPMDNYICCSPAFANGVLYIARRNRLFAIDGDKDHVDPRLMSGYWPQWRGPNRDNVSSEKGLLKEWPESGPPLRWRVEGIGEGISSLSIAEGRILTVGYVDGNEYAIALNQSSGELLWSTRIGSAVLENPLMRLLSQRSPTIDGERAYFATASGELVCLASRDGRELWRKNYVADFGGIKGYWGYCDYPLIDGEKLICTPGGAKATIVALHKETGAVLWKSDIPGGDSAAYAAMVVSNAGGIRQYVAFLERGLVGIAADNGQQLWRYEKLASDQNSITPIVLGDQVLCASGRNNAGLTLLKIIGPGKGQQATEQYFQKLSLNQFQDNLLVLDGYVYGTTRYGLFCAELATGHIEWEAQRQSQPVPLQNSSVRGQSSSAPMSAMVAADGQLYLRQADGIMKLVEANPTGHLVKGSFVIPDAQPSAGATHPVIAGGYCFLRDNDRLFCYDVRNHASNLLPPVARTIKLDIAKKEVPAKIGEGSDATKTRTLMSVFVPTPQDIVDKMLELAEVKKSDVVYDLGSGDGRIVISAAQKFGCRAVGYELDKDLVAASHATAEAAGVKSLVNFELRDLFTVNLRAADVIAVYLLPQQLEKLIPQLEKMKPGTRVVSHQFEIPGVPPDKVVMADSTEDGAKHTLYLWTLPLKKTNK